MTVNVYKPTYKVAGKDHKGDAYYEVTMKKIGTAKSYEEAKKKYGGYPIVDGFVKDEY